MPGRVHAHMQACAGHVNTRMLERLRACFHACLQRTMWWAIGGRERCVSFFTVSCCGALPPVSYVSLCIILYLHRRSRAQHAVKRGA